MRSLRSFFSGLANYSTAVDDSQGQTPLHRMFQHNRIRTFQHSRISRDGFGVVQLLVGRGTDVNTRDKNHLTPLHYASYDQHLESVRVLLDYGANVNVEDSSGQTPLHQVFLRPPPKSYPRDYVIPQLLAKHSADVNARDEPRCISHRALGSLKGPRFCSSMVQA